MKDLPIDLITDVNYAFYNLKEDPSSGHLVIASGDEWADMNKRFVNPGEGVEPQDSWNDNQTAKNQFFGNFVRR